MNIHSYGHFKILNDDINENLRDDLLENMHRRFERAVGSPITMDYDGSGSGMMTLELSNSFTTLPTTTVSIIHTTLQSSQSTMSVTTNSVYPTSTSMTVKLSTVTSTSTTTTATTTTSTSTTTTATTTTTTSTRTTTTTTTTTSTTTTATTTTSTSTTTTATTSTSTSTTTATTTTTSTSTTTTATTTISTSTTTTTTTTTLTSTTTTATTTTSTSTTTTTTTTTLTSTTTATTTTTSTSTTTTATTTISTSTTTTTTTTTLTSTTTTATTTPSTSTTTTTTTSSTNTNSPCSNSTDFIWWNNICTSKKTIQNHTVNALLNLPSNASVIADLLSLYVDSITNSNTSFNENNTLSIREIDDILANISSSNLTRNTTNSILIVQASNQLGNIPVLGASFTNGVGGAIVQDTNLNATATSQYSAAAIISIPSLTDVTSLSMLIIGNPLAYQNIDQSNNKTLASPIIVASVRTNSSSTIPTNISLSFQPLDQYRPININYFCSFYDTNTLHWNESGCTAPILYTNTNYSRYECICNHLTSFALIWSQIPPFNPETCDTKDQIRLTNGTCVSKSEGAAISGNALRNSNNTNSTVTAEQLTIYMNSISGSDTSLNSNDILTLNEIDELVRNLTNVTFVGNTTSSFIIVQPLIQGNNIIVLGASFVHNQGGNIVDDVNQGNIINSPISTAAVVNRESLVGVISLNMLIIDNPSTYRTIDNSSNKTLASSVIVASLRRNTSEVHPIEISLYFQILPDFKPNNTDVDYYCSFFDTLSYQWNESGCTTPNYNQIYNRYQCKCNHLTSFALIWLPKGPPTRYLDAQDIASLVFQSISILCFLAVITHALFIRLRDPLMSLQAYDLLPLISSASTTLLFIFYIALGMTVYTRTSSSSQTQCFTSSSVLMFIVYFFVIFMFCTKTSVGYFNYLRFVRLFPQPRFLKLVKMLIISFFVSMTWVLFAIGFNLNSSFEITELYPYKLCWFTKDVLHYFLTIPAGMFLLINIILFICIAYRIINHVRYARSAHQTYERMKRCVLVLLSSCLSQGIGWLFGPVLSFVDPIAGEVLGWFFIIFNGLEGLWSILLYLIILSKRMDIEKRVLAAKALETVETPKQRKYKISSVDDIDINETNNRLKTSVMNNQWVQDEELPNVSDDLDDMSEITFSTNTFGIKNDDLAEFSF